MRDAVSIPTALTKTWLIRLSFHTLKVRKSTKIALNIPKIFQRLRPLAPGRDHTVSAPFITLIVVGWVVLGCRVTDQFKSIRED